MHKFYKGHIPQITKERNRKCVQTDGKHRIQDRTCILSIIQIFLGKLRGTQSTSKARYHIVVFCPNDIRFDHGQIK